MGLNPRLLIPVAVVTVALFATRTARAQDDQVTTLTIDSPAPGTFTDGNPFRTNSPLLRIDFTHNGGSGTYFISTMGAAADGSIFLPQPDQNSGNVIAGLVGGTPEGGTGNDTQRINLVLLQTRLNVVAQTDLPVVVRFDDEPPNIQGAIQVVVNEQRTSSLTAPDFSTDFPQRRRVATPDQGNSQVFLNAADFAGATPLTIRGSVTDNFSTPSEMQLEATSALLTTPIQVDSTAGNFTISIPSASLDPGVPDGIYEIEIVARDRLHDPENQGNAVPTVALGNESGPLVIKVIVDRVAPRVEKVEIIHTLSTSTVVEPAGPEVFVSGVNSTITDGLPKIRVTVSEPLVDFLNTDAEPPRVIVAQNSRTANGIGTTTEAQHDGSPQANRTVFTFNYPVIALENRNGPVALVVTGRAPGAGGIGGFGTDQAGNPIDCTDGAGTLVECGDTQASYIPPLEPAFIVDSVAPDLRRENGAGGAITPFQRSNPQADDVITARDFPAALTVQIADYNESSPFGADPFGNDQASGPDFGRILPTSAAGGQTTTGVMSISLSAVNDRGVTIDRADLGVAAGVINGITGSQAPTTLTFTVDPLFRQSLENSTRDSTHPLDGTYTVRVNMIDRVNNIQQQSFTFRVDTRPISEPSLIVTLTGTATGSQIIQPKGSCVRQPGAGAMEDRFPTIEYRSTDADFSTTQSTLDVIGFFNGVDSDGYDMITTSVVAPVGGASAVAANVQGVRKIGFPTPNFPIPGLPGAAIGTGGTALPGIDPGQFDPRAYIFDGPYTIRLRPSDFPGNRGVQTTDGRIVDFVDYDVNLDTKTPFTERTFPEDNASINAPLRFVDATVVDPPARRIPRTEVDQDYGNPINVTAFRWVPGCGIDIGRTEMLWRLEEPYRPNNVDRSLIIGGQSVGALRGSLRFIHIPNPLDPTRPGFNPNDDRFKIILELTDQSQNVRTLPTNGTMDGIYSIAVNPVDRARNSMLAIPLGTNQQQRTGAYFGLSPSDPTTSETIDLTSFFFLFDTAPPRMEVENFPDGVLLGGFNFHRGPVVMADHGLSTRQSAQEVPLGPNFSVRTFRIEGRVRDLSSRLDGPVGALNTQGGSGIDHVEYDLRLVDQNFNLVPGIPRQFDPATGLETVAEKRNPIIPLREATLESFEPVLDPASLDAQPTTTNPLIGGQTSQGSFGTFPRPSHKFTIADELPETANLINPQDATNAGITGAFYLLTIRAVDRAGNVSEIARRVTLNVNSVLEPPTLLAPRDETLIPRNVVEFTWQPATNVTTYILAISDPNSNVTTRQVAGTRALLALPKEGRHLWSVQSTDQLGNIGPSSANRSFTIDRTNPVVQEITLTDNVEPNRRSGVINLGDFLVSVKFSEPLDPDRPPGATFTPPSVPAQELTTVSFSGDTWVGRGNIPTTASPASWDGLTTVQVLNVFDRAGNRMTREPDFSFEIDTGPDYETRFFFNPTDSRELILTMVATEELVLPPRVTELTGVAQISNRSEAFRSQPRAFFTGLRLNSVTGNTSIKLTISGEDLDGNASKRVKTFTVTPINSTTARLVASADGRLTLDIPEGAVVGEHNVFIFPPENEGMGPDIAQSGHAVLLAASQTEGASANPKADLSPELVEIEILHRLGPDDIAFVKPVNVRVDSAGSNPEGIAANQLGLYLLDQGQWRFVGASSSPGYLEGQIRRLGAMRVMADTRAPSIEMAIQDGERLERDLTQVTAFVRDGGSGVDPSGIQILMDGQVIAHEYIPESGAVMFEIPDGMAAGRHRIELAARDRTGNIAQRTSAQVLVNGAFGVVSCLPYPNPARYASTVRFQLTQPVSTSRISLDIYDVAGRRVRRIVDEGPFVVDHDILWDLTTSRGEVVGPGIYVFNAKVASTSGDEVKVRGKIAVGG